MTVTQADHTALSNAIETGNLYTVESLIRQHPELVSHPDWTLPPIHCAVLWNQPGIAELLLDNGADIETLDPDRQTTPLRYAIMEPTKNTTICLHGTNMETSSRCCNDWTLDMTQEWRYA